MSPSGAAAAGVLTHLPGPGLSGRAERDRRRRGRHRDGVLQVVVYNGIWFSLAIVALTVSIYRPSLSRQFLDRLVSWVSQHRRMIIVGFFGVAGRLPARQRGSRSRRPRRLNDHGSDRVGSGSGVRSSSARARAR